MVHVELVFADLDDLFRVSLSLPLGATVEQALTASSVYEKYPDSASLTVGIFSKRVALNTVLKDGDRIELYRPLKMDPKINRRKKAQVKKRF